MRKELKIYKGYTTRDEQEKKAEWLRQRINQKVIIDEFIGVLVGIRMFDDWYAKNDETYIIEIELKDVEVI